MEVLDEDLTGASKPKRGRPSLEEKVHRIGLRESVLNLWLVRKHDAGFQDKTNSEFAEFLLKVSGEKFDVPVPQSSPATPSNHAAMGKFKYYYIFQQCFLELYLLDQVKCQLFYFFFIYTGPLHSTPACETHFVPPLFYTTPSSVLGEDEDM